jgi:protein ImuA
MRPAHDTAASHARISDGDQLAALRHMMANVERAALDLSCMHLPLGLHDVDRHLPGAGLACGALHEVAAATHGDRPAAFGFAVALTTLALRAHSDPALLIAARRSFDAFGKPYGHGLCRLGLDVSRLILVETRSDKDALWALEEALRSKAVAIVVGAVESDLDLTRSRRLSLAAAASGTPLVLLRAPRVTGASAALTRWRIANASSVRDRFATLASSRWSVALERCRNGRSGQWLLELDHVTHRFRMAQELADCPPLARTGQRGLRLAG